MLLALFLTNFAFAESAQDLFTPVATDKLMLILGSLFGKLGVFGGSTADPMIGVVQVINGGALAIAGLITGYVILTATLGTAHDGEVMGKKHSIYMPIRLAVAIALVIPVKDGYNVAQLLTSSVIVSGIGMADTASSKFVETQNLKNVGSGSLTSPDLKNLGYKLFASYSCMNMIKANISQSDVLYKDVSIGMTKVTGLKNDVYYFGNTTESSGIAKDACGQLEVPRWQIPPISMNGGMISAVINAKDSTERMLEISKENQKQTAVLMQTVDKLSSDMISSKNPVNPVDIENAIGKYKESVSGLASQLLLNTDQFSSLKKSVDQDGFVLLGAYFQNIAKLQNDVGNEMANIPVATGVTNFNVPNLSDKWDEVSKIMNQTSELSGKSEMNFGVGNAPGGSNKGFWDTLKDFTSNFNPTVWLKKAVTSDLLKFDPQENILLKVEKIGGWTLTIASGLWVAVGGLSSTIGNLPGLGMFVVATMTMIVPPLILFGFTCLYIIPFMPFLIWLGCILAYVISCVEAIIGSSLWAVSMIAEGHEIMGQGQNGFKQMLSLLLKPILLVAGFSASVSMINIFGSFVTFIFSDVWNISQSDSGFWTYLLGMFALPFLYVTTAVTLIKKCFDIMSILPDQIINWIGGAGSAMSGHAKDFSGAIAGGGAVAGMALMAKGMTNSMNEKINDGKNKIADYDFKTANPTNRDERMRNSDQAETSILDELEGNNSFSGEKARSMINQAVDVAGGKGSVTGNEFMNQLKKSIQRNPSNPLDRQINSAMNAHLIDKFGSGSGRVVGTSGKGYFTNDAEQTMGLLSKAYDKLGSQGLDDSEIKDVISKANSSALESFSRDDSSWQNNGSMGVNDFFVSELNKSLDDRNKFFEPSVSKDENISVENAEIPGVAELSNNSVEGFDSSDSDIDISGIFVEKKTDNDDDDPLYKFYN